MFDHRQDVGCGQYCRQGVSFGPIQTRWEFWVARLWISFGCWRQGAVSVGYSLEVKV